MLCVALVKNCQRIHHHHWEFTFESMSIQIRFGSISSCVFFSKEFIHHRFHSCTNKVNVYSFEKWCIFILTIETSPHNLSTFDIVQTWLFKITTQSSMLFVMTEQALINNVIVYDFNSKYFGIHTKTGLTHESVKRTNSKGKISNPDKSPNPKKGKRKDKDATKNLLRLHNNCGLI